MGSVLVVVLDVFVEHPAEMATTLNQRPVEAFVTHGTDEAFGEGVGFRCSHRGADHPDAFCGEDGIEGGGEFGVPIPDQRVGCTNSIRAVTSTFVSA